MKKHILIPATAIFFFVSSSALANSSVGSNDNLKKSSQKQTTVKYEFSLFQIAYSLIIQKADTALPKATIHSKKEGEQLL